MSRYNVTKWIKMHSVRQHRFEMRQIERTGLNWWPFYLWKPQKLKQVFVLGRQQPIPWRDLDQAALHAFSSSTCTSTECADNSRTNWHVKKKTQNLREIASETCPYENLNLLPFLCQTNIDFDPKLSNHSNRMCETVIVVSFGMVVSIRR